MPQIIDERNNLLTIQGKMSLQKFDAYINDCFRVSQEKGYYVISGWVESESFAHQESCQRIALEFLSESSVGVTKYFDCAKIFFAHKEQIPIDWTRQLDFKIKKIHQSTIPPSLVFILMYQPSKAPSDPALLPKIMPIYQEPYTEPVRSEQPIPKRFVQQFSDDEEETFEERDLLQEQRKIPRQVVGGSQYQRRPQMELENQGDLVNRSQGNNFRSPMVQQQGQRFQPRFQTPRTQQQAWPKQQSFERPQPSPAHSNWSKQASDSQAGYPRRQAFSSRDQGTYQMSRSPANSTFSASSSRFPNTSGYPSRTPNQLANDPFETNSRSGSQTFRDTYSESARYPSYRKEDFNQRVGGYKANLLNTPLRNLGGEEDANDAGFGTFQSRGGYQSQTPRGSGNFPSYKSGSQNFKPYKR